VLGCSSSETDNLKYFCARQYRRTAGLSACARTNQCGQIYDCRLSHCGLASIALLQWFLDRGQQLIMQHCALREMPNSGSRPEWLGMKPALLQIQWAGCAWILNREPRYAVPKEALCMQRRRAAPIAHAIHITMAGGGKAIECLFCVLCPVSCVLCPVRCPLFWLVSCHAICPGPGCRQVKAGRLDSWAQGGRAPMPQESVVVSQTSHRPPLAAPDRLTSARNTGWDTGSLVHTLTHTHTRTHTHAHAHTLTRTHAHNAFAAPATASSINTLGGDGT